MEACKAQSNFGHAQCQPTASPSASHGLVGQASRLVTGEERSAGRSLVSFRNSPRRLPGQRTANRSSGMVPGTDFGIRILESVLIRTFIKFTGNPVDGSVLKYHRKEYNNEAQQRRASSGVNGFLIHFRNEKTKLISLVGQRFFPAAC